MSTDFKPTSVRENPVIFHKHAYTLRGAAELASKVSVERYLRGSYSDFDQRIESILPHTWLNSIPTRSKIQDDEREKDEQYSEEIFPRPWSFRHKKRWVLDTQLSAERQGEIPGDLIQTSLTKRQVDLRKKILISTSPLDKIRGYFTRWLERGEDSIFHLVKDDLLANYIFFHPADCLSYVYRNERSRKALEGNEFYFIKELYMTQLNVINRWYFYGKPPAALTDDSASDKRVVQRILRGAATWKYLALTRRDRFFAEPFIIWELGKYHYPERSIWPGSEIETIANLVLRYQEKRIFKETLSRAVEVHCSMLSEGDAPLSADHLLQKAASAN